MPFDHTNRMTAPRDRVSTCESRHTRPDDQNVDFFHQLRQMTERSQIARTASHGLSLDPATPVQRASGSS